MHTAVFFCSFLRTESNIVRGYYYGRRTIMKIYYPSYEQNRKHILRHTDFIESVVMNTPTCAYTHQIYAIVNGVVIKKHYRKTLSSALKTQMRIIEGEK